jgi:hypothetical protein
MVFRGGRMQGRSHAMALQIAATAPTKEDRDKLAADLATKGIALQDSEGRHVPIPENQGSKPIVFYDSPG